MIMEPSSRETRRPGAAGRGALPCLTLGVAALLAAAVALIPAAAAAQETGAIQGRVSTTTGAVAQDVEVRLVGQNRLVRTDAEGAFTLADVQPGVYLVEVRDERLGRASERVTVVAGETTRVTISLSPLFHIDALVVTAGPLASRQDELFQAARVVGGRDLRNRIQASLGETLATEPGVSSTYFGPGSSRPIIRGLGGDRVRILENGVGTGDASNTSPDHAVSLDPASAERIEIVRGPATLLYGSSAIGGVVNVLDGRIPTERPASAVSGEFMGTGGSAADERAGNGRLEVDAGPFVLQARGSLRETGDYGIPGYAELEVQEDPSLAIPEDVPGTLENSFTENQSYSVGASFLGSRGYVGLSTSGYDQLYGVPGGHEHEEGAVQEPEEEDVTVDLRQRRVDLAGELRFDEGFLEAVKLRVGANDYRHFELEGGAVGTIFQNDQWEGRLEGRHRGLGGLQGAVGIQALRRDFVTQGAEAFTPPNQTDLLAAFVYEEADLGSTRFQLGGRYERQESSESVQGFSETFHGVSLSTGARWDGELVSFSVSGSRSVKLPTAEELFSDGPHLATRSFEIGDRNLEEEVAWTADATFHVHLQNVRAEISGFLNSFDGYIYPDFTGNVRDGLDEVRYTQADARFLGVEARAEVELFHAGEQHLGLELTSDYVRATLVDQDRPLPRIPPFSLGAGLRYEGVPWQARFTVRQVAEQDRVAEFEEPTPGYTMVDASVGYRIFAGGTVHEVVLQGRNLTEADARTHASLLKAVAPLPGRDLRLMYRIAF